MALTVMISLTHCVWNVSPLISAKTEVELLPESVDSTWSSDGRLHVMSEMWIR